MGKSNAGKQSHHKKYAKRKISEPSERTTREKTFNYSRINQEKTKQSIYTKEENHETTNAYSQNNKTLEEITLSNKPYQSIGILNTISQIKMITGHHLERYLNETRKTINELLAKYNIKDLNELEEIIHNSTSNPSINENMFSYVSIEKENRYKIMINTYAKDITIKYHLIKRNNQLTGKIRYIGSQNKQYLQKAKENTKTINNDYLEEIIKTTEKINKEERK